LRDAIFVISVGCDARTGRVGHRDHAAALIGMQVTQRSGGGARSLIPCHRLIIARAMDIAPQDRPCRIALDHQPWAQMFELRGVRPLRQPGEAACGIIIKRHPAWRGRKPVFRGVAISAAARAGQIAPTIVAQRGRTRTGELVETVGAISAVDVVMPRPGIKIGRIGPRDPRQLACGVIGDATHRQVVRRAVQVLRIACQTPHRIITDWRTAHAGAPCQIGAAAQIVVSVGNKVASRPLLDRRQVAGIFMVSKSYRERVEGGVATRRNSKSDQRNGGGSSPTNFTPISPLTSSLSCTF
jgi:hypothetical protein